MNSTFNFLANKIYQYTVYSLYARPNYFCSISSNIANCFEINLNYQCESIDFDKITELTTDELSTDDKRNLLLFAVCLIEKGPTQNELTNNFLINICNFLGIDINYIDECKIIVNKYFFEDEDDTISYDKYYERASLKNLFYANMNDGDPYQ